jgi:hypothetical protein|tara:strand:+ start:27 stop:455 length:429 start_codon:yes stop_codon:yes gene_type:complete
MKQRTVLFTIVLLRKVLRFISFPWEGFGPPFFIPNKGKNMKRILDTDPETGTTSVFHANEHDQTYAVETRQDVSSIISEATALRNTTDRNTRYGEGLTKVASIPMTIYSEWLAKGWTKDQKKMKQLLNDPEIRKFRTREGKV